MLRARCAASQATRRLRSSSRAGFIHAEAEARSRSGSRRARSPHHRRYKSTSDSFVQTAARGCGSRVDVGGHGPAIRIHLGNHRAVATLGNDVHVQCARSTSSSATRTANRCRSLVPVREAQDRATARRRSRCRFPRAVHAAPSGVSPGSPCPFGMSRAWYRSRARGTRPAASRITTPRHRAPRAPASSRECSALLQLPRPRPSCNRRA